MRALAVLTLLAGGCSASLPPLDDGCARRSTAPRALAFSGEQRVRLDQPIRSLAAADFDGDRKGDLVVLTDGSLRILSAGPGLFTPTAVIPASGSQVVATDLDGDRRADLLLVDDAGGVSFYHGRGDGTFDDPAPVRSFAVPVELAAADVNRDGLVELFAAQSGSVQVFHDAADGYALSVPIFATGAFAARDVDGDGLVDLLATDGTSANGITLVRGTPTGTFAAGSAALADGGVAISSLTVCDFDGDGAPDLAAGAATAAPRILRNDGTLALALPATSFTTALAAGDFDGDGLPDLVSARDLDLSIFLNRP